MRLLLLRHAKSDRSQQGLRDHDRPLNARGRKAGALLGRYMADHGLVPDHAIVSTATRTRQTWDLLAAAWPKAPAPAFDDRLYNAHPDAILKVVRETQPGTPILLVLAHNPGLEELALALTGEDTSATRHRIAAKFPTAGLAIIDFPGADWHKIHNAQGRLVDFITPKTIAADDFDDD